MNRKQFMEELENMLENIQENEREEALQYYNDYFDEAGVENEEQVIRELGTPAKVAAIIKTSLQESEHESAEFTERGYFDPRFTINYEVIDQKGTANGNEEEGFRRTYSREIKDTKETSGGKIALIVILCLLALPVILPIAGALLSVVIAILATLFSLFLVIAVGAFSFCIAGVVVFVVGLVTLFSTPIVGVFGCGVGLILAGLGVLLVLLTAQICCKLIPWIIKGIVNVCRMPLRKRGVI